MCDDHNLPKNNPINRRDLLSMLLTAGASMAVIGCSAKTNMKVDESATATTASGDSCVVAASETNGPFPADGSNASGDGSSTILDQVYSGLQFLEVVLLKEKVEVL